ncbi:hypothetical protein RCZ04_05960 [Capnocytophaga sp. HP1101]
MPNNNPQPSVKTEHLTTANTVRDLATHKVFTGFGDLLLPYDDNSSYYSLPLAQVARTMPYHSHVRPEVVLGAVNHLIDEADSGKTIFYNIYSEAQRQADPRKQHTGVFFFRGKPNAPFAIVCPGGGFSYVGSLHEGLPLAKRISELGYNAFVIRYRIGSEQYATEDLAAAIAYVIQHAKELGVSAENYSLWGSSAGARMVGNIAYYGAKNFTTANVLQPATAVIAYTGQSTYSNNFPPTFLTVASNDPIASADGMQRRTENLRLAGVPVAFHRYQTASHGFGLGTGTDAEGWLDLAVQFWKQYIP